MQSSVVYQMDEAGGGDEERRLIRSALVHGFRQI